MKLTARRIAAVVWLAAAGIAGSGQLAAQNPPPSAYPPANYPPPNYPSPGYPAQAPPQAPPPPSFSPQQLEPMVSPIALYPDPLLAQVLTAATYSNEIPDADGWSRAHSYLRGDQLAAAIREDNLPWDPSVVALLPFPSVLDYMAGNMGWTTQLGDAVLANRAAVMDAVQVQRQRAMSYGYLRTGPQYRVVGPPGAIEILPVDPAAIWVPYYDPRVVFFAPRPGFFIGGAISFGPASIFIGSAFAPWGWGGIAFGWRTHDIIINNRPWGRTWTNRATYVHPYALPPRSVNPGPRVEHHQLQQYRAPARKPAARDERKEDRR